MIAAGTFREDLYHRLKVFSIELPPLRSRREDLRPLVEHFLQRQTPPTVSSVSEEFWTEIERRAWHGNVRELRNAVDHAVVLARGGTLNAEHLPSAVTSHSSITPPGEQVNSAIVGWVQQQLASSAEPPTDLYRRFLTTAESALFGEILRYTQQNRSAAAKLLGVDRATLRAKLDGSASAETD